jgi:hypothetical protein
MPRRWRTAAAARARRASRPHYHPDYYGAYVRDPDGNKLCVCCHGPEPTGTSN